MSDLASVDPTQAQRALHTEVERLIRLLRSVRNPDAPALGQWTVAEVAMHLSQAWVIVPALATKDRPQTFDLGPSLQSDTGPSTMRNIWELGAATVLGVRSDEERDPRALADRIAARAKDYFAALKSLSSHEPRPWLVEGVEVSLQTLTCHLLNETMVHGFDIAVADRQPWTTEPAHAALVLDGFLIPVIQALDPRALVDQEKAAGLRVTYELHIRGGGRYIFAFDNGILRVGSSAGHHKVDCHLSADPVALLLVAWSRRSQWSAIARGQLLAWGRKPWLGPKLRKLIRNP